jgi:DNA modification methylase
MQRLSDEIRGIKRVTVTKVEIGNAVLYLGDCRDLLSSLPPFDALVTDPPYGISYASNFDRPDGKSAAEWHGDSIAGDDDTTARDFVLKSCSAAWACFGSLKRTAPQGTRATLVWDKGPASGMGDLSLPWKPSYELIFIGGQGWNGARDEGVIKGHWSMGQQSAGRRHPNEKPASLMALLVAKAPGSIILDPFMGSGSTGVACANLGRQFIGIEIEPKYFDIACERIEAAYAQQRLFA